MLEPAAYQIVGFTDAEDKGIEGIEFWYNDRLSENKQPLRLSLDIQVQKPVQHMLHDITLDTKAYRASAIVLDLYANQILALANSPTISPDDRYNHSFDFFSRARNKAVIDTFEFFDALQPINKYFKNKGTVSLFQRYKSLNMLEEHGYFNKKLSEPELNQELANGTGLAISLQQLAALYRMLAVDEFELPLILYRDNQTKLTLNTANLIELGFKQDDSLLFQFFKFQDNHHYGRTKPERALAIAIKNLPSGNAILAMFLIHEPHKEFNEAKFITNIKSFVATLP